MSAPEDCAARALEDDGNKGLQMKMMKVEMKTERMEVMWMRLTRNRATGYQNMNIQSTRTLLRIRRQLMKLGLENLLRIQ